MYTLPPRGTGRVTEAARTPGYPPLTERERTARHLAPPLAVTTLVPFSDCWVCSGQPDVNLNGDGIGVGRWVYLNRSFLRFAIPKGTYSRAILHLYGGAVKTPARCEIYYTMHGFTETGLTWNNQPAPTTVDGNPGPWGILDPVPPGAGWFSVEIAPFIVNHRAGTNLNLILKGNEGAADSYFYAEDREAGSAYAPLLFLTEAQLTATLTAQPTSGPAPLPVDFTIGISAGAPPYAWSLDPGDGSEPYTGTRSTAGSIFLTHTYAQAGTFTATLTVTDASGAAATKQTVTRPGAEAQPTGARSLAAAAAPIIAGAALLKRGHR